ncbi:MAG: sigma-70 family RNA polymerase sigma factor [Planctomycetales bacterium]|nr:sigma-70 family RNA polymerase sigma factor [Planctomycetales bacterium]
MVLSDSDRTLIQRCLEGHQDAWAEFINRYLGLITHVVNTAAQLHLAACSRQTRDDVISEILLSLVDKDYALLRRFRGQSSFGTYLTVIARRIAVRTIMKLDPAVATNSDSPLLERDSTEVFAIEDHELVHALLDKMPGEEATAIRLFHLEHRSYQDIGSHMGIPENSVGPLLSRARQRMRSLQE